MIALAFLTLALVVIAAAICGHLSRIADAVEAQNRYYGVTGKPADEKKEAVA